MIGSIKVTSDGMLRFKGETFVCALGRSGVIAAEAKREGDGATPIGTWPLRRVYYRADRISKPDTALPVIALDPEDGWCDDPTHPDYNRPVRFPFDASAEHLWRDDHLYDVIVVLGHNDDPPVPPKGSAIFFHLAKDDYAPTEGCVAVHLEHMLTVLKAVSRETSLTILG